MFIILNKNKVITGFASFSQEGSIEVELPTNIVTSIEQGKIVSFINNNFTIKENPRLNPTIIISGNEYQVDNISLINLRNAIISMDNGETIDWKMKDNSIQTVTREELKLVLKVIQARSSQRVL